MDRIWLGHNGGTSAGDPHLAATDPTEWFDSLSPDRRAAEARRTRDASAARDENRRKFLAAEPGYGRYAPHPSRPLDADLRRLGLVAPLLLGAPAETARAERAA